MTKLRRRDLLTGTALVLLQEGVARGGIVTGRLPWEPAPERAAPPPPGQWRFFTPEQAAMVEALADRLIPPDPQTPGGKDAGCAVFIDRQLAGPYGHNEGLYNRPPFVKGIKQQGPQSPVTPAELYRTGLAALDRYCRAHAHQGGKGWVELQPQQQDGILHGLQDGSAQLTGIDGKTFFQAVLKDVQQG
ncbi:MAG: gluconate 2-dehydrogenase subunit 3 family protein, partial [Steroidobacteraceae bacterium]